MLDRDSYGPTSFRRPSDYTSSSSLLPLDRLQHRQAVLWTAPDLSAVRSRLTGGALSETASR